MRDYNIKQFDNKGRLSSSDRLGFILSRLEGVKKVGNGWVALCPAHDDHNPSLSIGIGSDGWILMHCFAGCSIEEICHKIISPDQRLLNLCAPDEVRERRGKVSQYSPELSEGGGISCRAPTLRVDQKGGDGERLRDRR